MPYWSDLGLGGWLSAAATRVKRVGTKKAMTMVSRVALLTGALKGRWVLGLAKGSAVSG